MNVRMWLHPATQANMATLQGRGVGCIGPNEGAMACNEFGPGRMAEPSKSWPRSRPRCRRKSRLAGRHVIVTSGPTHEPIDPVRYLANRSSGRQGHSIAAALAALGARVTLVSGPVSIAGSGRRHGASGRECGADAGRVSGGVAGRCRRVRCRGRRLAGRQHVGGQDQEGRDRADVRTGAKSRHTGDHRGSGSGAASAGGWFRGRNGRSDGECSGKIAAKECGLDRGE